jgi:hypothetical protein
MIPAHVPGLISLVFSNRGGPDDEEFFRIPAEACGLVPP